MVSRAQRLEIGDNQRVGQHIPGNDCRRRLLGDCQFVGGYGGRYRNPGDGVGLIADRTVTRVGDRPCCRERYIHPQLHGCAGPRAQIAQTPGDQISGHGVVAGCGGETRPRGQGVGQDDAGGRRERMAVGDCQRVGQHVARQCHLGGVFLDGKRMCDLRDCLIGGPGVHPPPAVDVVGAAGGGIVPAALRGVARHSGLLNQVFDQIHVARQVWLG